MVWNAFFYLSVHCHRMYHFFLFSTIQLPSSYHVTTYSSLWKTSMTTILHQITNQVKPSQTVGESKQKRKIKRLGGVM